MPQTPYLIHHLLVTYGDDPPVNVTVRVRLNAPLARGLGIWPETFIANIAKPERDKLPSDLSTITAITIRIGLNDDSVDVIGWRIVDVKEAEWGAVDRSSPSQSLAWDLTLEDSRSRLNGGRGGTLFDGLLNPVDPAGQIIAPVVTCSALVTRCISAIGVLTYREGTLPGPIIESLDAYDPPSEILWRGADAPTELQRLLEWTRHAFAFNQDGTYSIVKLVDPPTAPTAPDVGVNPLPSAPITLAPNTSGKCIITSAPTRNLIERNRTLTDLGGGDVPLQFVGVDTDGSIASLTSLSWWPSGKTPIQVFNNEFADVAEEHRALAEASVYRMFRLHDDDLANNWTFVSRLIDAAGPDPAKFLLLSSAARQDELGMWSNPAAKGVESGVTFDLRTGVFTAPRPLVRVTGRTPALHAAATELGTVQLDFTFGHHPSAGDYSDYFMSVYYFASGVLVGDDTPSTIDAALAEGVPVYHFPDLQVQYRETPLVPGPVTQVNLDAIKAIAIKYADALITQQSAQIEIKEYPGLHNVDPDGSVTRVVWVASVSGQQGVLRTVVHLGTHAQITSDYLQRVIQSRVSRGPGVGAATARGNLIGVSRSAGGPAVSGLNGPSSGARDGTTHAAAPTPIAQRTRLQPFDAKITAATPSGTNRWSYTFVEVYKSNTGLGATPWSVVSGGVGGTAYNRFELINDGTGANYLGIGITNDELNDTANSGACAMDLRPVPDDVIVQMWPEIVRKGDGTVVVEYLFTWANGVYEESA